MDTYHVVLYVHLLSPLLGISAGAILMVCLFQLRAARTVEQPAPFGKMAGQVSKLFPVRIIGLFGTGAYMTSKFWTWNTRWIDVAIAVLVVLILQGAGIAERTGKKLEAALRANGPGELGPECRRLALHPGLWVVEFTNLGLVFAVVWNMTEKPGLGGSLAAVLVAYAVGVALALLFSRASTAESLCVTKPSCRVASFG